MITKACASRSDGDKWSARLDGLYLILLLGKLGTGSGSEIQDSLSGGVVGSRVPLVKLWLQRGDFPPRLLRTHISEGSKYQRACSRSLPGASLSVLPQDNATEWIYYSHFTEADTTAQMS